AEHRAIGNPQQATTLRTRDFERRHRFFAPPTTIRIAGPPPASSGDGTSHAANRRPIPHLNVTPATDGCKVILQAKRYECDPSESSSSPPSVWPVKTATRACSFFMSRLCRYQTC